MIYMDHFNFKQLQIVGKKTWLLSCCYLGTGDGTGQWKRERLLQYAKLQGLGFKFLPEREKFRTRLILFLSVKLISHFEYEIQQQRLSH